MLVSEKPEAQPPKSSWVSARFHVRRHKTAAVSALRISPSVRSSTPLCRKLLKWLLPLSLPHCTLTVSCMAPYELSVALKAPNRHCSPEISVSPSGDLFTLWNSVYFPPLDLFLPQLLWTDWQLTCFITLFQFWSKAMKGVQLCS